MRTMLPRRATRHSTGHHPSRKGAPPSGLCLTPGAEPIHSRSPRVASTPEPRVPKRPCTKGTDRGSRALPPPVATENLSGVRAFVAQVDFRPKRIVPAQCDATGRSCASDRAQRKLVVPSWCPPWSPIFRRLGEGRRSPRREAGNTRAQNACATRSESRKCRREEGGGRERKRTQEKPSNTRFQQSPDLRRGTHSICRCRHDRDQTKELRAAERKLVRRSRSWPRKKCTLPMVRSSTGKLPLMFP